MQPWNQYFLSIYETYGKSASFSKVLLSLCSNNNSQMLPQHYRWLDEARPGFCWHMHNNHIHSFWRTPGRVSDMNRCIAWTDLSLFSACWVFRSVCPDLPLVSEPLCKPKVVQEVYIWKYVISIITIHVYYTNAIWKKGPPHLFYETHESVWLNILLRTALNIWPEAQGLERKWHLFLSIHCQVLHQASIHSSYKGWTNGWFVLKGIIYELYLYNILFVRYLLTTEDAWTSLRNSETSMYSNGNI